MYIIRHFLIRQGSLYHFKATLDQKAISKLTLRSKKLFLVYDKNWWRHFVTCDFLVLRIVEENKCHIWNLRKFWARNKCFSCPDIHLKIWPYLTWPWPVLRQKLLWMKPYKGQMTVTMTQKTCVARHVCNFYFIVTFCDLTLTFISMPFVLMQHPLWTLGCRSRDVSVPNPGIGMSGIPEFRLAKITNWYRYMLL